VEQRSYRERIEDFMRRWLRQVPYEGNRVLRVLASLGLVAVVILLVARVFRMLRVLTVPAVVVVGGWLLISWIFLPIPRLSSDGPVVRNGVAAVVACGKTRGIWGMEAAMDYVPEPRTGTWGTQRRGDCTVYYHHPPDATQRFNRQLRSHAERGSASQSVASPVWACGRRVPTEYRDLAKGMRKDCGIFGEDKQATGSESGAEAGGEDLQ